MGGAEAGNALESRDVATKYPRGWLSKMSQALNATRIGCLDRDPTFTTYPTGDPRKTKRIMSSSVQLISSATFANQRKALLRLIDELRDIDIKNELDLPRIVVVGVS